MCNRLLILFLTSTSLQAATVRPLDELRVLEVPISRQGLTRMKVQEDRISQVFGNTGEYVVEVDSQQGQVFIRPLGAENPINLTLTTEKGYTQDLRLLPKDQAPEALILTLEAPDKQEIDETSFNEVSFNEKKREPECREDVESLMVACQDNRIPLGYTERPVRLTGLPQRYVLVRELYNKTLLGLTYRIQNTTQHQQILSEPEIAKDLSDSLSNEGLPQKNTLIAILIPNRTLAPGEQTDVYVVARAH